MKETNLSRSEMWECKRDQSKRDLCVVGQNCGTDEVYSWTELGMTKISSSFEIQLRGDCGDTTKPDNKL